MEARTIRAALLAAITCCMVSSFFVSDACGASYRTANFIVQAPTALLARQFGDAAEGFRRDLAIEWLGHDLPRWAQPCPISTHVGPHLGAGGATTFIFDRGQVFSWQMTMQGSKERILDSVLPHEVTHTIFATHFRRPLPRWADEGACTSVEHISERTKQHHMLVRFLKTGQGIPFDRMFAMTEYPKNIMPLYSQGYSSVRFLIAQGGKRKFIQFMEDGFATDNFPASVRKHYGYQDLAVLQNKWLDWVRVGSPQQIPSTSRGNTLLASRQSSTRPAPNLVDRRKNQPTSQDAIRLASAPSNKTANHQPTGNRPDTIGWYSRNSHRDRLTANTTANARSDDRPRPEKQFENTRDPSARHEAVRPQPIQKSRQIILEWSRSGQYRPRPSGPILDASIRADATLRR